MPPDAHLQSLWTRYLACPGCQADLRVGTSPGGRTLECTQCASRYPVRDGIPSFVPVTGSAQAAEIEQRDREVVAYEGNFLAWENFLEIVPLMRDLAPKKHDVVLDVGAGTGRFVREYIRDVAAVVAVDHSLESLRYMGRSLELVEQAQGKLVPVHADACALPVRARAFDSALSVGMLQHLPTTEHRARAVQNMARALRPGGRFILQARHWSGAHAFYDAHRDSVLARRVAEWLIGNAAGGIHAPRASTHAGGTVSIYNLSADELATFVEQAGLHLDRVVGRLQTVKGMNRLGVLRPVVERILEHTVLSLVAAQEIVALATQPFQ